LEHARNVSINANKNSNDIAKFVESEVERLIKRRLLLDGNVSPKLRAKIIRALNKKAQGMFRWVALSLEALQRIKFKPDFENALGRLPPKLSDLYDIVYAEILKTEINGRYVAVAVMKWLLCAQRLLSIKEVIAAVSFDRERIEDLSSDPDTDSTHEQVIPQATEDRGEQNDVSCDDIVRLCRNLVVIDAELAVFRFAHQSVQEYLQHLPDYTVKKLHTFATESCLDVYLSTTWPSCPTPSVVRRSEDLKPYAQIYWPVHLKFVEGDMSDDLRMKVWQFMLQDSEPSLAYTKWADDINSEVVGAYGQFLLELEYGSHLSERLIFAASSPATPLAAVCAFGFSTLMAVQNISAFFDWNQQYVNKGIERGTLLCISAEMGYEMVVKLLLARDNIEVNLTGRDGKTPLWIAASEGHEAVVKLLLARDDIKVNMWGGYGRTPLWMAASRGHKAVVKLLLAWDGIKVNLAGQDGRTPLLMAASKGHEAVVKLLLARGDIEVNLADSDGETPLWMAASEGHEAVVKLLLARDHIEVNLTGRDGKTPLWIAASEGHEAVVKLLEPHSISR
jgi:ankyrin repeat protein